MKRWCRLLLVSVIVFMMASLGLAFNAGAQESGWNRPINLSRSGSASAPQIVPGEEGAFYVYWWDRFDGTTVTRYGPEGWSEPEPVAIRDVSYDAKGEPVVDPETDALVLSPVLAGGTFAPSADGRVNAFFPATTAQPGPKPLRQAQAILGTGGWFDLRTIISGVAAWRSITGPDGAIHLVFMFPVRGGERMPGLYYMRSDDGGVTWGEPVLVAESLYVRLASQGASHIALVAAETGALYLTWNEPGTDRALFSWSWDRGESWTRPQLVDPEDPSATQAQIVLGPRGYVLLVWEGTLPEGERGLMMSYSPDGGWNWTRPERILSGLKVSISQVSLCPLGEDGVLLVAGGQSNGPILAFWQIEENQEPKWSDWIAWQYPIWDIDALSATTVQRWQAVCMGTQLHLIGLDKYGDVWHLTKDLSDIPWNFTRYASWGASGAEQSGWSAPVRIAPAGAFASPQIVADAQGHFQAFWWHLVEGLTSALERDNRWFRAQPAVAFLPLEGESPEVEALPMQGAQFLADNVGRVHAFWRAGHPATAGDLPLRHGMLRFGTHRWEAVEEIGLAALWQGTLDESGTLHVVYLHALAQEAAPVGIYYRRYDPAEGIWFEPILLQPLEDASALLEVPQALAVAASNGTVWVAWAMPDRSGIALIHSEDGGMTWSDPQTFPGMGQVRRVLGLSLSSEALFLIQTRSEAGEGQWQQIRLDATAQLMQGPQMVLPSFGETDGGARLERVGDRVVLLTGLGTQTLEVAIWRPEQAMEPQAGGWSISGEISLSPEKVMGGPGGTLGQLQGAFAQDRFLLMGVGGEGEVWASTWKLDPETFQTPTSPWTFPQRVDEALADLQRLSAVGDRTGRLHMVWSPPDARPGRILYAAYADGQWLRPNAIVAPPEGIIEQLSLASMGDRLYAVWVGGTRGRPLFASTFTADASMANAWPEPVELPSLDLRDKDMVTHPQIVADAAGGLHVVYAVPINERRGIYYTRSDDGGKTWSPAQPVCDAASLDWPMVDEPTLAVDYDGALYVAFLRKAPVLNGEMPMALYIVRSLDGGKTWSEPKLIAEGELLSPSLLVANLNEVHLIWDEGSTEYTAWHTFTVNGGVDWSLPMRVRGFARLPVPPSAVTNGAGWIYLVGAQKDAQGRVQLLRGVWQSNSPEWQLEEPYPLPSSVLAVHGLGVEVSAEAGYLDALLQAEILDEAAEQVEALLHLRGAIPAASSQPVFVGPSGTEPAPSVTATPWATPTPRPTINIEAPPPGEGAIELGPLGMIPVMSLGGILAVALIVIGVFVARGTRRH